MFTIEYNIFPIGYALPRTWTKMVWTDLLYPIVLTCLTLVSTARAPVANGYTELIAPT